MSVLLFNKVRNLQFYQKNLLKKLAFLYKFCKSFETTFIWNNCWQLLLTLNFKTRSDVNVVISTFPQLIPLLTLHIFRFLGKTLAKRCDEILNSSQYPLKQYVCFQILPSMNVDSNRHGGLCAHYGCMHVNSGHDLKKINNVIRIKFI